MTSTPPQPNGESPLLRAYLAIEQMEARIRQFEYARREPIAIVGMGCRFPGGADDPDSFWDLLQRGIDTTMEVPAERWDADAYDGSDAVDRVYARRAALLSGVDLFDPAFFGISPREAIGLDPQQRLLLEVSWEALERAGIAPDRLSGTRAGVFVGLMSSDYAILLARAGGLAHSDAYAATGNDLSFAAGRLSYTLGLQGPSVTLTTACSSALVALHLACQSLRDGECDLALAGGVNLILVPDGSILLSRLHAISPDGRCKTFDAAADGYGRGEGCGVVVLKRLSDARRDGDPVLAVVRGSATNHDGPSGGLTVPSGLAQQSLIACALERAGVVPAQVGYVEAHGTGTPLGDPIELHALGAVYGVGRDSAHPLLVGSVKTNIGHLEAAAGVAGLIKVVLSLQHATILPHLHFRTPNPHIDWSHLPLRVPIAAQPWVGSGPRVAGVSAFGLSGVNAHALVESAPDFVPSVPVVTRPVHLLALSARSAGALRDVARRYATRLRDESVALADVCYTANCGRAHFAHRLVVSAASVAEVVARLDAFVEGQADSTLAHGLFAGGPRPKVAFLFSGQGAQYVGMGRELYATQPVFRAALDECAELLLPHIGCDLRAVLYPADLQREGFDLTSGGVASFDINGTGLAQPALFAVEYALAQLWRSWGVEPDVVLGHSLGEYVAACVAGVFGLGDALRLVAERGRLMQALPAGGTMVAVRAGYDRVMVALAAFAGQVAVAALNGPDSTVISGEAGALAAICADLEAQGVKTQVLEVSHAFHSPLIVPMLGAFEQVARTVVYAPPQIAVVSNVRGALAEGDDLQCAGYWCRHAREPVQFERGVRAVVAQGVELLIEVGPHPVLLGMARVCLPDGFGRWLPSLRRGQSEWGQILGSLGQAYIAGLAIDWAAVDRPYAQQRLVLPTYPFQRRRYWVESAAGAAIAPVVVPDSVARYYDHMAAATGGSVAGEQDYAEFLLTFPPFLEVVPGFSWLLTMAFPGEYPDHSLMLHQAQQQARDVLFQRVDFAACRRVLDIGCGYASDLLAMARRYAHLELHGYTVSPEQARIGNRKVLSEQLQGRVKVYHADSTRDEFPMQYDLVLGFEVACHIKDRDALFAHIDRHLCVGGLVLLADFAANAVSAIVHEETSSYLITRAEWCDLLARYKLRLLVCTDATVEVGYFFEDPGLDAHMARVAGSLDSVVLENYRSYGNMGKMLQRGLVSYLLLTVQKDSYLTREEIAQVNRRVLEQPSAYVDVVRGLAGGDPLVSVRRWLYMVEWREQVRFASVQPMVSGHWLIFADGGGVAAGLAVLLRERGMGFTLVTAGDGYGVLADGQVQIDAADPRDYGRLFAEVAAPDAVIYLWGLDGGVTEPLTLAHFESVQVLGCQGVLLLLQALVASDRVARLWLVTAGAQSLGAQVNGLDLARAPLWGFGRSVAQEYPQFWGGLVDLDPGQPESDVARLWQEIVAGVEEEQVAFRAGLRYVARLRRCELSVAGSSVVDAGATYLVTGGLGALGLQCARWLIERGARTLVLLGRRGLVDGGAAEVVRAMEAGGARVVVVRADVSDSLRMREVFAQIAADLPPLRGVVHAAGWSDYVPLVAMGSEQLWAVMRPKVVGAWVLHELTLGLELDFLVCFSSIASLWGSAGMAHYAAANAFLDGFAHQRRACGLPATSINWGPWAGAGLLAGEQVRLERVGLLPMLPELAVQALGYALGCDVPQFAVADVVWSTFQPIYEAQRGRALLRDLGVGVPAPVAAASSVFLEQLERAVPSERRSLLMRHLCVAAAAVLKLDPSEGIEEFQPLRDLGLDSLMAVELRNHLEVSIGRRFPATLLIDYPTLGALTSHLVHDVLKLDVPPTSPPGVLDDGLDDLSEDDLAALLAEELAAVRQRRTV